MRTLFILLLTCGTLAAQSFTLSDPGFMARDSSLLTGLAAYYKLEETLGLQRLDSVGTNHLTVSSSNAFPTNAPGKVFYGNSFSSALVQDMYRASTPQLSVGTNTPLTISLWFKPATVASFALVSKATNNNGNQVEYEINVSSPGGGSKPYFQISNGTNVCQAVTAGAISAGNWYHIIGWYDTNAGSVNCQVNGGAIASTAWTNGTHATGGEFHIGQSAVRLTYANGIIDEVGIWKRALSSAERARLLQGVTYPGFYQVSARVIDSPKPYQVFQRVGTNGDIFVSGNVGSDGTHTIEARFNGGAWQTIQTGVSSTYSGLLTNQPQGQGAVDIRYAEVTNNVFPIYPVGIGDVFAIGGQSNASGRAANNQACSNVTYFCSLLANSYKWKGLSDQTDSILLQLDLVSNDGVSVAGSTWPILAAQIANNQNIPVAMIPCAMGGTDLGQWQPGVVHTNRTTLYGSMTWRSRYANYGPPKALLWWQGENDANGGTNQSTYYNALTNLAANYFADVGAKVMPCKLQHIVGLAQTNQDRINLAIADAWTNTAWIITGPDLSPIDTDSGSHITTDAGILSVALRWWTNIQTAFY